MYHHPSANNNGIIAITVILGTAIFVLAIASVMLLVAAGDLAIAQQGSSLDDTFYYAESGLNEALYRLISDPIPGSYSFMVDGVTITIDVESSATDPYQRIVRATAANTNGEVRTVQITANTSSFSSGFDYAVQGGSGGIYLDNNSLIVGDAYSNGSILPASGGARGNIQGSAWAALANTIDRVEITEDMYAHTIARSTIAGEAHYTVVDAATTAGGAACPNPNCFPGSTDPDVKQFPIDTGNVTDWKNDIIAAGNPIVGETPATCPASYASGTYCITSSESLGNQKIEADFYIGNGASLTLTGNLWITGKIIMDNNGTVSVDPSLGGGSVVVIADGTIEVNNNYSISGSGDPRSFVLIVSTSTSTDVSAPAIYASNNSASIIFAALNGMLKVKNNGFLNAVLAESLYLEPNSTVTYNPSLAAFTIPNPTGNTIHGVADTWEEL